MRKQNIYFTSMLTVVLSVSLFLLILSACSGGENDEGNADSYELLTVKTSNHELQTDFAAQVKGRQDIRIIPRVEGYLQEIKVLEGQHVKQGQLLFVIDQVAYRAAVKTAEASVEQAKALVDKAELE